MAQEPIIYARLQGDVLEVATDRLTLRTETGALVAIEDHVRQLFARVAEIRIMTLDEAPWTLSRHVIAPPLQRVA
ncbi:MAG: hypothetical protein Q8O26_06685 [Phreatobacter sp.]|uniref:hypothetical protein n=1 Tax=Phreatobacter sp. TaxID=1966341 RepID=UPI0027374131|nr:hypothetical protein [Phreatobacter sp.]MDP2801553.1 hypothetical protein [Phreatobacter sp.]